MEFEWDPGKNEWLREKEEYLLRVLFFIYLREIYGKYQIIGIRKNILGKEFLKLGKDILIEWL